MADPQFESLHNHTVRSDGSQDYQQMLKTAEDNGIGVMAFTDHDVALDQSSLDFLRSYEGPVRWISGIEISSRVPPEYVTQDTGLLHVLGLFIDPFHDRLREYTQQLADSRHRRMQNYVKHLRGIGFTVKESDCLEIAGDSPIGSPHIVKALEQHPQNQTIIDSLLAQLKDDARNNDHSQELLQRLESYGPSQTPYILFMKKDSFIPFHSNGRSQTILHLDDTVELIHDAGGIAMLAHWYLNKKDLPPEVLETLIQQGRIDGIELAIENTITEYDFDKDRQYLLRLAREHDLATALGSDAHSKEDLEYFTGTANARSSIGQAQRLIDRFDVPLTWTNYETA